MGTNEESLTNFLIDTSQNIGSVGACRFGRRGRSTRHLRTEKWRRRRHSVLAPRSRNAAPRNDGPLSRLRRDRRRHDRAAGGDTSLAIQARLAAYRKGPCNKGTDDQQVGRPSFTTSGETSRIFPVFMRHLESVTKTDDKHSHWKAKAPLGQTVEWDAELTSDIANR